MSRFVLAAVAGMLLLFPSASCRPASGTPDKNEPDEFADCRPPGKASGRSAPPSGEFTRVSGFATRRLAAADSALKLIVTPDLLAGVRRGGHVRVRFLQERSVELKNRTVLRTTEIVIPLEGRWERDRTLFYYDTQYRQWLAVASTGQVERLDDCR